MVKTNFFVKLMFFMSIFGLLAICQSVLDLSTTFSEINGLAISQVDSVEIDEIDTSLYIVKEGESIFSIADTNNIAVETIMKINNLEENPILHAGQWLLLPDSEELYSLESLT